MKPGLRLKTEFLLTRLKTLEEALHWETMVTRKIFLCLGKDCCWRKSERTKINSEEANPFSFSLLFCGFLWQNLTGPQVTRVQDIECRYHKGEFGREDLELRHSRLSTSTAHYYGYSVSIRIFLQITEILYNKITTS